MNISEAYRWSSFYCRFVIILPLFIWDQKISIDALCDRRIDKIAKFLSKVSVKSQFIVLANLAGFVCGIFLCSRNWKKPRKDMTNKNIGETGGKDIFGKLSLLHCWSLFRMYVD